MMNRPSNRVSQRDSIDEQELDSSSIKLPIEPAGPTELQEYKESL